VTAPVARCELAGRAEGSVVETVLRVVAIGSLAVALSLAFMRARAVQRPN
jgi:hypothetical protein